MLHYTVEYGHIFNSDYLWKQYLIAECLMRGFMIVD